MYRFRDEFGCPLDNFSNTTHLYAQYTRSQLCSAMIQESIKDCQLKPENSKPLCLANCVGSPSCFQLNSYRLTYFLTGAMGK